MTFEQARHIFRCCSAPSTLSGNAETGKVVFEFLAFAVAVCIYNLAWNMTHPFLLAAMASFDRRGRIVVYAVAMQMVGLAIGPGLAASVISEGIYSNVNWLGATLFIASLALILPPVLAQARLFSGSR